MLGLKTLFCKPLSSTNTCQNNTYIPKEATQQEIFLSKYSTFDGRDITIAIIDSGFDVSLEGLQQTSEGRQKVIDCFDFTGVGNVETCIIREIDSKNNILVGLNERKLKIPKNWKNPSGKWHLGLKALFKPTMSKMDSEYSQKLPKLDCIVWNDGRKWCACIETYKNNLKMAKVLTNFRDKHEFSFLKMEGLEMAYCITVHKNGNLLEIFMPYDHHGSVVSQIAAGHFPTNPKKDGLAPGAQLFFMSVIDPHDGYAINLQALKKALLKCIEMKVDIINCSINSFEGDEKNGKIIRELVNLHNILLFKCAGNRGPFYATIFKCDKNVEDVIFKIGAALTPEIKKWIYNLQIDDKCPPEIYEFSSRGPGAMSSQGLDFVAPGAAITRSPKFAAENYIGLTGTSYSCPNAAGVTACLLTALKHSSIKYSPKSIKFVLTKTAKLPQNRNKFEFGHGIIQIFSTFDYFCNHSKIDFNNIIPNVVPAAGGIFFTQNDDENDTIMEREIDLSKYIEIKSENSALVEKWKLEVSPKSAKDFIELPLKLDENNLFKIKIDTKNLEAGSLNFAEILVIDPLIGAICNIPLNAMYILKVNEFHNFRIQKEITLNYEKPYHLIFYPCFEESSNYKSCEIKITALENTVLNLCIQYVFWRKNEETVKILDFIPKIPTQKYSISVENKATYEFCIYQKMGSSAMAKFNLEFDFQKDNQKEAIDRAEDKDTVANELLQSKKDCI